MTEKTWECTACEASRCRVTVNPVGTSMPEIVELNVCLRDVRRPVAQFKELYNPAFSKKQKALKVKDGGG
jgi:hypothetical protein